MIKYFVLCIALFAGVLSVFHSVEQSLEKGNFIKNRTDRLHILFYKWNKAHEEYQSRLLILSERKRRYGHQTGNLSTNFDLNSKSTMRKLNSLPLLPDFGVSYCIWSTVY